MSISQTTLALLIALLSIATTFLTLSPALFTAHTSDIRLVYEGSTRNTVNFFAHNAGQRGGLIAVRAFSIDMREATPMGTPPATLALNVPMIHESAYIGAGKEARLEAKLYPNFEALFIETLKRQGLMGEDGKLIPDRPQLFIWPARMKCAFKISEVSTDRVDEERAFPISCDSLRWVSEFLFDRLLAPKP
jgi:hypothetical protein